MTLVLLGQVLELRARSQTGGAIRRFLGLRPKTARADSRRWHGRGRAARRGQVGDRLRVRPGEKVPVDGVVLEGAAQLDESMVTANRSRSKSTRAIRVIGATVNGTGTLVMRAERVGRETLLAQIVRMVAKRSAAARRFKSWPTWWPAILFRPSLRSPW